MTNKMNLLPKTVFHYNTYDDDFGCFPRRINILSKNDMKMIRFMLEQSEMAKQFYTNCNPETQKDKMIEFVCNSVIMRLRAFAWLYIGDDRLDISITNVHIEPLKDLKDFSKWKKETEEKVSLFTEEMFEYTITVETENCRRRSA